MKTLRFLIFPDVPGKTVWRFFVAGYLQGEPTVPIERPARHDKSPNISLILLDAHEVNPSDFFHF